MDIHGIFYHTITINGIAQPVLQCVGRYRTPMPRVLQDAPYFTALYHSPALFGLSLHRSRTHHNNHLQTNGTKCNHHHDSCIGSAFLPIQNLFPTLESVRKIGYLHVEYHFPGNHTINCPLYAAGYGIRTMILPISASISVGCSLVALLYMERDTPSLYGM